MKLAQLKLLIGNDDINALIKKSSQPGGDVIPALVHPVRSLMQNPQIESIFCDDEKIIVAGKIKDDDFTAILKPFVDAENNRIGIKIDDISIDRPPVSWLNPASWWKIIFPPAFLFDNILSSFTMFFKKNAVEDQIKTLNVIPGVSAEEKTLWFDINAFTCTLPVAFCITEKITTFSVSPKGIELTIG
ncbi:MAG: hypothetical protein MJ033_03040 [Victivallaceae bacterium]|nr:hypothetical protein [Victivallaceae bacterium]